MTDSCHEQVVQAALAVLTGISGVAGLAVERDRETALEEGDLPRLVLFEGAEIEESPFAGERSYRLQLDIEGTASGATPAAAAAAASTLRAKVQSALGADPTLGGKVRLMEPASEPPPERLELPTGTVSVRGFVHSVVVEFATAETDAFTFAS